MNKFNLFSKDYDYKHPVNQFTTMFIVAPAMACAAAGLLMLPGMVVQRVAADALGVERVR